MQQIQISLGNMPISLILVSTGVLAFVRTAKFKDIFDADQLGTIRAVFNHSDFTIGDSLYSYDILYEYREQPAMLEWLKLQKLQLPVPNNIFGGF